MECPKCNFEFEEEIIAVCPNCGLDLSEVFPIVEEEDDEFDDEEFYDDDEAIL